MSTYTPIATQTLGSAAASVTFSSIPQGYTDLVVVMNLGAASSGVDIFCQVNADTGSNYSHTRLTGNGTTASSGRASSQSNMRFSDGGSPQTTANSITTAHFMNYSNATTNKTVLNRASNGNRGTDAYVNLWRSTSAITSINIYLSSGNITSGSTFSIYGIQVGTAAQKAQGGNIVTSDGTYVYHTFTSSGSFIPSEALSVDYLVVAGGGGGGWNTGGGGGAGGYRTSIGGTALSLTAKSYPVIVGAGGVGGTSGKGTNGADSIFSTITATGGGGGGSGDTGILAGNSGGSGGGSARGGITANVAGGAGNAGSYSPVEGYAGGANGPTTPGGNSGGGGGSSAVGAAAVANQSGAGGNGTSNSISGTAVTYAGGGGGGSYSTARGLGGTGGGGNGALDGTAGSSGTVNLGGGGGGGNNNNSPSGSINGYAGGSGIVIIRYAI